MNRIFQQVYHVPGALSANLAAIFKAYGNMQLLHVSAVGSNEHDAILTIGAPDQAEAHLAASPIGEQGTPAAFKRADFAGGQYPRISAGDLVAIGVDYDGDQGTAVQDLTLVLTFAPG